MSKPRIISGEAKGKHLKAVPGNITRPITGKVKEALFNIIGMEIDGSYFLDLFGGTGSVGLEAISRGADFVVLIDKHRAAYSTIKENVLLLGFEDRSEVLCLDALKYLGKPPERDFDFIFVAPPQYKDLWKDTLTRLDSNINWMHSQGTVIVQIDVLEYEKIDFEHLVETDQRRYGDTLLVFYDQKPGGPLT